MIYVEIYEFEVEWYTNRAGTAKTTINLVGIKVLLFKPNGLRPHPFFYPLFDEKGTIIGT